jgi:hypothetical protein
MIGCSFSPPFPKGRERMGNPDRSSVESLAPTLSAKSADKGGAPAHPRRVSPTLSQKKGKDGAPKILKVSLITDGLWGLRKLA